MKRNKVQCFSHLDFTSVGYTSILMTEIYLATHFLNSCEKRAVVSGLCPRGEE